MPTVFASTWRSRTAQTGEFLSERSIQLSTGWRERDTFRPAWETRPQSGGQGKEVFQDRSRWSRCAQRRIFRDDRNGSGNRASSRGCANMSTLRKIWVESRFIRWSVSESMASTLAFIVLLKLGKGTLTAGCLAISLFCFLNALELFYTRRQRLRRIHLETAIKDCDVVFIALDASNHLNFTPPPRTAKFLLLMVPKRDREYLIGDLEEEFQTILLPEYGLRAARLWYWWQVLSSITPLYWGQLKRFAALEFIAKILR